jgi:hypothetical protein
MRTIIITEQQRRVILHEMAKNEIDKTIGENDKLIKRIAKEASEQINFDLSILGTFSLSIGGLMGPVERFLSGQYPEFSSMEQSLILAGIAVQYVLDNKKPLSLLVSKIKEKGLYDAYKQTSEKTELLKDSFLSFVESLGVSVKKTANIIGYTFLIPLVPLIYQISTSGDFNENQIFEIIKRLSGFVALNVGGISLKELLNLIVKRFRK